MKYYAGIGSRQTPPDILDIMAGLAVRLARQGYILRSGAADGADAAFELGCSEAGGKKEIYLPWKGFNGHSSKLYFVNNKAQKLAESLHPAWNKCSQGAKKLLARNCYQLLGQDLATPVEFVVCWTKHAQMAGGTALGIRLAESRNIPVYNLADEEQYKAISEKITKQSRKTPK